MWLSHLLPWYWALSLKMTPVISGGFKSHCMDLSGLLFYSCTMGQGRANPMEPHCPFLWVLHLSFFSSPWIVSFLLLCFSFNAFFFLSTSRWFPFFLSPLLCSIHLLNLPIPPFLSFHLYLSQILPNLCPAWDNFRVSALNVTSHLGCLDASCWVLGRGGW